MLFHRLIWEAIRSRKIGEGTSTVSLLINHEEGQTEVAEKTQRRFGACIEKGQVEAPREEAQLNHGGPHRSSRRARLICGSSSRRRKESAAPLLLRCRCWLLQREPMASIPPSRSTAVRRNLGSRVCALVLAHQRHTPDDNGVKPRARLSPSLLPVPLPALRWRWCLVGRRS